MKCHVDSLQQQSLLLCICYLTEICDNHHTHHITTVLWPFFWDHPGEPVREENFWTLWCKGRLTEINTPTIRLGATPSGLTSAHLHHPHIFFTCRMPFLPPNQQHQSAEGIICDKLHIINSTKYTYQILLQADTTKHDAHKNTLNHKVLQAINKHNLY